jgi:hypothetical protein
MESKGAHGWPWDPWVPMKCTHGVCGDHWNPWVPAKVQIILYVGTNPPNLSLCQEGCLDNLIIRIGDVKTD